MATQKDQINASVILNTQVYERLKNIASIQKRSISKQIALWVEERLVLEENKLATDK